MTNPTPERPAPEVGAPVTLPVRPKDWISNEAGRVAMVKAVDVIDGKVVVDLWLYDDRGRRTGRESPVCGGPRTFEPSCDWIGWHRIDKPTFPVPIKWVPNDEGGVTAAKVAGKRMPDREWVRPGIARVRRSAVRVPTPSGNLDPVLQATALRIAAQEMRDVARKLGEGEVTDEIRIRVKGLEAEADLLSPRP